MIYNRNGLYNSIKGDVDKIVKFRGPKMEDGTMLRNEIIDNKVLEISINEHELIKQQINNIKRSMDYAKEKKVELKFIIEK
ncbi:endonuclease toxin domain-containing protein [Fusobacterium hwasookii]